MTHSLKKNPFFPFFYIENLTFAILILYRPHRLKAFMHFVVYCYAQF